MSQMFLERSTIGFSGILRIKFFLSFSYILLRKFCLSKGKKKKKFAYQKKKKNSSHACGSILSLILQSEINNFINI